ncbi:MAG: 3D domain-containing protein [Phycisphaerae bacterium]|nr:3D domain-containing protein [Phycisphaerae bacterium]
MFLDEQNPPDLCPYCRSLRFGADAVNPPWYLCGSGWNYDGRFVRTPTCREREGGLSPSRASRTAAAVILLPLLTMYALRQVCSAGASQDRRAEAVVSACSPITEGPILPQGTDGATSERDYHDTVGPARLAFTVRRMRVTAYCPCAKCCGAWSDGITASGEPVTANGGRFCAADKSIPFGTMLDIPGYGTVPVLDRGGAIKGDRIDVFFPSHQEALAWGVRWLDVGIRTEQGE